MVQQLTSLNCSSSAHKDCKCVSMVGCENVMHQWAVRWTEVSDQPDEASFCTYCEEPYSGYISGQPETFKVRFLILAFDSITWV